MSWERSGASLTPPLSLREEDPLAVQRNKLNTPRCTGECPSPFDATNARCFIARANALGAHVPAVEVGHHLGGEGINRHADRL